MLKSLALGGPAFDFLVRAGIGLIGWTDRRGVHVSDGVEHCKPHGTYYRVRRGQRRSAGRLMADAPKRRGLAVGDVIELRELVSFGTVVRQRFVVDSVRAHSGMRIIFRAEDGTLCALDPRYLVGARIIKSARE
jgi:hypothetical protein